MKLRVVKLRNFQAHTCKDVELDPGITTLVGPSDAGKSAVLRALEHVMMNTQRGSGCVTTGKDSAKIHLRLDDGCKLTRATGKQSYYKLDGELFKAFGVGVPAPIEDLLRVTEINFQGQHDPVFWLSEKAGAVSKHLNGIVDLSAVDTSMSFVSLELRRARAKVGVIEERLEEARKDKKRWAHAQERAREFKALKSLRKELTQLREDRDELAELIERINVTIPVQPPGLGDVVRARESYEQAQACLLQGRALVCALERSMKAASAAKQQLDQAQHELTQAEKELTTCPTCGQKLKPSHLR